MALNESLNSPVKRNLAIVDEARIEFPTEVKFVVVASSINPFETYKLVAVALKSSALSPVIFVEVISVELRLSITDCGE